MTENLQDNSLENLTYSNTIVNDFEKFKDKIISKTIIPYQVEFQPPPSMN